MRLSFCLNLYEISSLVLLSSYMYWLYMAEVLAKSRLQIPGGLFFKSCRRYLLVIIYNFLLLFLIIFSMFKCKFWFLGYYPKVMHDPPCLHWTNIHLKDCINIRYYMHTT